MKTDGILYWILYFIVTIIVAWIALSLVLLWFRPVLFNADGSVSWWNTLWVAALVIIFSWLIVIIIAWIIGLFLDGGCKKPCADPCKPDPCAKPDPCDPCVKKVDPCDPCAKKEMTIVKPLMVI